MPSLQPHDARSRARRRMQLKNMPPFEIDKLAEVPIATAQAILTQIPNPSPILRGTTAKYLSETLSSLAGFKHSSTKKLKHLIKKLAPPGTPITYATLETSPTDELESLVEDALALMPFLKAHEAHHLSTRFLTLIDRLFELPPSPYVYKAHQTFQKFVPEYKPAPTRNLYDLIFAPPHKSLFEQLADPDAPWNLPKPNLH